MSFNGFGPHARVGLAFCTPWPGKRLANGRMILEPVPGEWVRARMGLQFPTNFNMCECFADCMEVGDARTSVVYRVLEMNPRPEYIGWLDYDVLCPPDFITKLFFRAQTNPDIDIFAGVYCLKGHDPIEPLIYAGDGVGPFWDWAVGDLLTTAQHGISSVHSGLTLVRTSLYQRMLDAGVVNEKTPFYQTTGSFERVNGRAMTRRGSEDLWFCERARRPEVNAQIMVDTSVLAGHIDKNTGITYGLPENTPPVQRARWMTGQDRKEADAEQLKLALDIGAGGRKREWPGYKTYTTDLRADTKPDYVQDTRFLNFPAEHWDKIASSHHLEHIGRWDQESVWREMARILKPGGTMEHIVPSVEWAACKIMNNQIDEHVLNVLYGAQEAHGYKREYNLHYFGYTKEIAKALAEQAGLVDVQVKDWRDDEAMGYELLITARKPIPLPDEAENTSAAHANGVAEPNELVVVS